MQATERLFLQTVGKFCADRVRALIAPLMDRIERIERALEALKEKSDAGPDAVKAVTAADVDRAVSNALAAVDRRIDGHPFIVSGVIDRDGNLQFTNSHGDAITVGHVVGRDADEAAITATVKADLVKHIAKTTLTADEVDKRIEAATAKRPGIVSLHIDQAGDLHANFSDGQSMKCGHVVGRDADLALMVETIKAEVAKFPKPKDGRDGFDLESFAVEFDGERSITFKFIGKDGLQKGSTVVLPILIDRGVYRDGESYVRGDAVSHEGSIWIAQRDAVTARPGTIESGWRLAVKRGRDGREGKEGQQGKPGTNGRDGRDLTQLGPDGRKW